jgi:hypothetical protein
MALESSTSLLDTDMEKTNAISKIVWDGKESLKKLGSWISTNTAKATLFTALTFWNPNNMMAQKSWDVVKNDPKKEIKNTVKPTIDTSKIDILKVWNDPIKDSLEYKAEREKLLKRWEIAKAENAKLDEKNAKLDEKNAKLDEKNTKLDKERAELDKERARIAIKKTQIAKINWPLLVFEKMKAEWREITAQDAIWANGRIESLNRVVRLDDDLKEMANNTIRLLEYIVSVWSQQAIVKNN